MQAVWTQWVVLRRKRTGVGENKGGWGQQAVELDEAIGGLLFRLCGLVYLREQAARYWWRCCLGCRRWRRCLSRDCVRGGCTRVELLHVYVGFWQYDTCAEGRYGLLRLRGLNRRGRRVSVFGQHRCCSNLLWLGMIGIDFRGRCLTGTG